MSTNATAAALAHTLGILQADPALAALVGGRIFEGQVPEADSPDRYPLVLVQVYTEPVHLLANGSHRVSSGATLSVRAVDASDYLDPLVPIAERIEELLDGSRSTTAFGRIVSCESTGETSLVEARAGQTWRYLGAYWRMRIT